MFERVVKHDEVEGLTELGQLALEDSYPVAEETIFGNVGIDAGET